MESSVILSKSDLDLKTPFYRTITEIPQKCPGVDEQPDYNYNSYTLFVLNNKFTYFLKHLGANITFQSKLIDDKMYLYIVPIVNGQEIPISQAMRDYLDQLTSTDMKHVILLTFTLNTYDSSWLQMVLPYINYDQSLNAYISKHGIEIDLSNVIDYNIAYNNLLNEVLQLLKFMDSHGYVANIPQQFIDDFSLVNVIDPQFITNLYAPNWSFSEILYSYHGKLSTFLLSQLRGNKTVKLIIGENLVIRHLIQQQFTSSLLFVEDFVIIPCSSYLELKTIIDSINIILNKSITGTVTTYSSKSNKYDPSSLQNQKVIQYNVPGDTILSILN